MTTSYTWPCVSVAGARPGLECCLCMGGTTDVSHDQRLCVGDIMCPCVRCFVCQSTTERRGASVGIAHQKITWARREPIRLADASDCNSIKAQWCHGRAVLHCVGSFPVRHGRVSLGRPGSAAATGVTALWNAANRAPDRHAQQSAHGPTAWLRQQRTTATEIIHESCCLAASSVSLSGLRGRWLLPVGRCCQVLSNACGPGTRGGSFCAGAASPWPSAPHQASS